MKKQFQKSTWYIWALLAVVVAVVAISFVPLLEGSKEIKPSGDYTGMTTREALFAECEARDIALSEEEERQAVEAAVEAQVQYASIGERYELEELLQQEREQRLFDKLCQALPLEVAVADEEVQEWYDVRLEALNNAYEKNPGVFKSQQDLYDKHGGVEPLVVPEGYVYVRHILVDDEVTANAVLAKLNQGEDFEVLMRTYGTDAGMLEEPYATLGYLVGPYVSAVDYYEEFKQAALELGEPGEYSDVVQTPVGYEIIQLREQLDAGERALEEVRSQIHTLLLNNKKSMALTALLQEWTD